MDRLRCVVERITYQNEQNGYSVIKCRAKGYIDLVTVVGAMADVNVGSVLSLVGEWKMDAKYGRQFSIVSYEETLPATVYGIEKYLGSGLVKGIGPKFAKRIVNLFGTETLNVIEENPDELIKVPGIGRLRVERIKKSWIEQKEIKNIMLFLQGHNVSTAHATKIWKQYGNESIKVVTENPYRLADDIWGIGFKTADTIASKLGFEKEKFVRLRSGLLYTLNRLSDDGHCYGTREQLLKTGKELLEVDEALLSMTLDEMIRAEDLKTEMIRAAGGGTTTGGTSQGNTSRGSSSQGSYTQGGASESGTAGAGTTGSGTTGSAATAAGASEAGAVNPGVTGNPGSSDNSGVAIYLPPFYFSEIGAAKRLKELYAAPMTINVPPLGLQERISAATKMSYDPVQMEAISTAVTSKILVLTGGPGTGKTTTTLGIMKAFQIAGASILLAAPTGRAAKRLSEATGMEAKTIHRLLEFKPPEGYQRNEENKLEGDVLIVDECSMIDIMLMYNLLKAIPDTMTLIMVGDIDQLPSVGAGNVLRDIIDSGAFPVIRLTKIFRQAATSRIITNAHMINKGQMPDLSNGKNTDFFFMGREDPEVAASTIVELVKTKLPGYYNVSSSMIQVLTPMQRGVVGAANLNQLLQEAVNSGREGLKRGGVEYRQNDKVMQIRNNYDKEVFNGDIGVVKSVNVEDRELTVDFDGREVDYDISELDELVLAYATTIHKSQGSEYPIVVMPVLMTHYVMLQRNLIYTGVTRAKKGIVVVGTKKAIAMCVRNVTVNRRNTMLRERLRGEA